MSGEVCIIVVPLIPRFTTFKSKNFHISMEKLAMYPDW